ncbi:MAG TPA: KpsF/GutQ family sugar-phosphate isomerase [Desulfurobacteriaceae bacterium]|nr:KpsF/GutQ family sugar-phosphate isomerase [Desulfurobacteriaceae bacterium]
MKNNYIDLLKKILKKEAKGILNLSSLLDIQEDSINKFVKNVLKLKGKLVFSGVGKSGIIAQKLASTFSSLGTPSIYIHPTEAAHGDLGTLQKEDIFVAISHSGETKEILFILPIVKKIVKTVVSITSKPGNSISRLSDINLFTFVENEACHMNLAPTVSSTVTLAFGDALAVLISQIKNFTKEDFHFLHPSGSLGLKLLKVKDLMKTDKNIPKVYLDTPMIEVIKEMSQKKLGCTLVFDKNNNLKGIITDGDLRRFLEKGKDIYSSVAQDAMTKNPKTIFYLDSIKEALDKMENYKITALPVVNESKKVVGIIHIHHILGVN